MGVRVSASVRVSELWEEDAALFGRESGRGFAKRSPSRMVGRRPAPGARGGCGLKPLHLRASVLCAVLQVCSCIHS